MDTHSKRAHQSGFSLIEIAIVLVIIGLLLGGVMKGQTMVQNSKIKRIATDTQSVQSAINAYIDSYWQLPGDDNRASAHFAGVGNGSANGVIVGLFEPANLTTDETALAWNHLRCAELVKGSCVAAATANVLPRNPVGGTLGIADGRDPTPTMVLGIAKKVVCMGSIPSAYAEAYDSQQDDGVGDTGDVRGSVNGQVAATPGTAQAYVANETIHICTGF
ncbi:MAG: type II secretion system protein [Magnetococcales bacterium]|nr:type II secretion system protein [Magnetococcales bacterium]